MQACYQSQSAQLRLIIVEGDGLTLLKWDWFQHLWLNWYHLNRVTQEGSSELITLSSHSILFAKGRADQGTTAKLYLKEELRPRFYRARQVPYAIQD